MIEFSWGTIALIAAIVALGGTILWLWQRNGRGVPGLPGLNGRDGRWFRRGSVSLTEATSDLIVELSGKVKQLERQVQQLEVKTRDSESRINILQGELALANSEVIALEMLIKEQAGRIGDLKLENEALRRTLARVMRKTGTLPTGDLEE